MEARPDFRREMWKLHEFAGVSTQLICMTATLPVSKEEEFFNLMGMKREETTVIRDVTTRENIAYSVEEADVAEWDDRIQSLVEEKKAQYPTQDKIIVYCRSIEEVKRLATVLEATPFYRNVGSEKEKDRIVASLRDVNSPRVYTTTNALGEGIDAPSIRVVIHQSPPDKLEDYGQQSGRGGRDGTTRSEAIVLRKTRTNRSGRKTYADEWRVGKEMQDFVRGDRCRRVVMDQFLDGLEMREEQRVHCEEGEEFCDVCNGHGLRRARVVLEDDDERNIDNIDITDGDNEQMHETRGSSVDPEDEQRAERVEVELRRIQQRRRADRIEQIRSIDVLRQCFEQWKVGCSICRVHGRPVHGHQWRNCSEEGAAETRGVVEQVWEFLKEVKWVSGWTCCTRCWVPQSICHSWETIGHDGPERHRKRGDGHGCQFVGVLREAVSVILACHGVRVANWIEEERRRLGFGGTGEEEDILKEVLVPFFGQCITHDGVSVSGMCHVFRHWAGRVVGVEEEDVEMVQSEEQAEEAMLSATAHRKAITATPGRSWEPGTADEEIPSMRPSKRRRIHIPTQNGTPKTPVDSSSPMHIPSSSWYGSHVPPAPSSPATAFTIASSQFGVPSSAMEETSIRYDVGSHSVSEMAGQLQRWKNRCVVCQSQGHDSTHRFEDCPSVGVQAAEQIKRWTVGEKKMEVEKGVGLCFGCGIPMKICKKDGGHRQEFKGVAIGFIMGVRRAFPRVWGVWWAWAQGEWGIGAEDEIPRWIGKKGSSDSGRLMEAFMWMAQQVETR